MTFATPWLLALLPLAALIPLWLWWRPPPQPALSVTDLGVLAAAREGGPGWRVRLRWLPLALRIAAVALLIVALARPQRGLAVTLLPEEGIDIALAFDVSGSMTERTAIGPNTSGPTRLEAARTVIGDFINTLEGDRAGLVIFQARSLVMSPLTLDHTALQRTVENVDTGLLPDGTAIGLGLAEALNLLRDSEARSRVVVLLTDGANNSGDVEPLQAAQLAATLDVRVYTIGFISGSATGADVDEATLQRIAEETDATYHNAATQEELARAYEEIGALERSRVGERQFTRYEEFGPWLAAGALGLLVCEVVLRTTALRRYP